MAHPCWGCGGECDCHGDIDDCIVSLTPKNCESCGCEGRQKWDDSEWDDEYDYDDDRPDPNLDYNCPFCGREYDEIDFEFQRCHFCAKDDD